MASAAKIEVMSGSASATTDIAVIVAQTPAIVLVDKAKREDLYAHIRREIDAFVPDVTTEKGRAAIKSLAFKVTKTKTAIDAAGKQLNEEARAKIGVVDEARRDARNTLDILAEQVRKPLTDWEAAEADREEKAKALIAGIWAAAEISIDDTAADVRARGTKVYETALDPALLGARLDEAQSAKAHAVDRLKSALARLVKEEADKAELEALRAEAAERDRVAAEQAAAAEAERIAAENARREEEARAAAEQAEKDRIEQARKQAAEEAQRAAEKTAQEERDRVQREHDAALAAERAKAAEIEKAAQAERDRVAEENRQREAREAADREAARKVAEEQAAREANKAHRTRVKTAAKQAIMTCGVSEDAAQKVVLAIIAGEIPAVTLAF